MSLVKHGAGKLKDEVKVSKNKKTGKSKVASTPLPQAPAAVPTPSSREKSDGEPA